MSEAPYTTRIPRKEEQPMNVRRLSLLVLLLASASPLFAQGGCFHSPEAPTDALLLVGSAGMFFGSGPLLRFLRSRNAK